MVFDLAAGSAPLCRCRLPSVPVLIVARAEDESGKGEDRGWLSCFWGWWYLANTRQGSSCEPRNIERVQTSKATNTTSFTTLNILFSYCSYTFFFLFFLPMSSVPPRSQPLVAPGHTRPVTHLSFSPIQEDGTYLLVSSCKDGNPMLREWTGDWVGTFLGHKGAVWSTKLSPDTSRAATGSADFTAYVNSPRLPAINCA